MDSPWTESDRKRYRRGKPPESQRQSRYNARRKTAPCFFNLYPRLFAPFRSGQKEAGRSPGGVGRIIDGGHRDGGGLGGGLNGRSRRQLDDADAVTFRPRNRIRFRRRRIRASLPPRHGDRGLRWAFSGHYQFPLRQMSLVSEEGF